MRSAFCILYSVLCNLYSVLCQCNGQLYFGIPRGGPLVIPSFILLSTLVIKPPVTPPYYPECILVVCPFSRILSDIHFLTCRYVALSLSV